MASKHHARLEVLLRDFDYQMVGNALYRQGVEGFTEDERIGTFRGIQDAVEYLIPIVKSTEFTDRASNA